VYIYLFANGLQYNDAGSPPEPPLLTPSLDPDDVITATASTPSHRATVSEPTLPLRSAEFSLQSPPKGPHQQLDADKEKSIDIAPLLLAMLIGCSLLTCPLIKLLFVV